MTRQTSTPNRANLASSRIPRYLQVASTLKSRLKQGQWAVGERIATIEELEQEFQVARVTIRQAVELLRSEGLLKSYQGKGTFVTRAPEDDRWLQLATDWESLIQPIRENVPHMMTVSDLPGPQIEDSDGRPAAAYRFLRSLQMRGKEPYAIARVHVATTIFNRAPDQFRKHVALGVIADMAGLKISRAHQTLTIGMADIETAQQLQIPLNAPTAEARCVVTDGAGTVIYLGEITYRGDCVKLNIELLGREDA